MIYLDYDQAIRVVGSSLLVAHHLVRTNRLQKASKIYKNIILLIAQHPEGERIAKVFAKEIANYEADFTKRLAKINPHFKW